MRIFSEGHFTTEIANEISRISEIPKSFTEISTFPGKFFQGFPDLQRFSIFQSFEGAIKSW